MNKYHAKRTWSNFCEREFASKAECARGEDLKALELYGAIFDLKYQVKFVLSEKPRISITVDFAYHEDGQQKYEDVKGVLTRDFRTKMAWVKEKHGIEMRGFSDNTNLT